MFSLSRRFSAFGVLIVVGVMTLSGCATKKYVRDQVGVLEPRITEVSNTVKEQAERIDAVDRRAQQGITAAAAADAKAATAQTAAATADGKAVAAQTAANTANQGVTTATTRIATLETRVAGMNDNYTAGPAQSVTFRVGSSVLSPEAKMTLDGIASGVTGTPNGYMVEIQGFTDSTGSEASNATLSVRRAESVLRYLVSKGVPLYRTAIVGLGEENPVADNKTRDGRTQNRRVEVRVLRSGGARPTN